MLNKTCNTAMEWEFCQNSEYVLSFHFQISIQIKIYLPRVSVASKSSSKAAGRKKSADGGNAGSSSGKLSRAAGKEQQTNLRKNKAFMQLKREMDQKSRQQKKVDIPHVAGNHFYSEKLS